MNDKLNVVDYELICMIVNYGQASKILRVAKGCGISGGTILLGKGTVHNPILQFMGLADIRKEIIYMAAERNTAYSALEKLNDEFEFNKPNHGIAFTTSICNIYGIRVIEHENKNDERETDTNMYNIITTIVDKGKAEDVIDAATRAGSKGGTIINARGAGIHETSKLFAMEIEPEKETVLILSEVDKTDEIVANIRESLKIDEAGKGIIFVQDAKKTYGIYK